jgi:hypothetical protein
VSIESVRLPDTDHAKSLTDMLQSKARIPAASPEFGFHSAVELVLADVGSITRDSGGNLTSADGIRSRQAAESVVPWPRSGVAAKHITVAALWRPRPANNTPQSPWVERPIPGEYRLLKDISYMPTFRSVENIGARA